MEWCPFGHVAGLVSRFEDIRVELRLWKKGTCVENMQIQFVMLSRRKLAKHLALTRKPNVTKQTTNAYCKYFSLPCDATRRTIEIERSCI